MSNPSKRLSQTEIDAARREIIRHALSKLLTGDDLSTACEAIDEALRLSGREAVIFARYLNAWH